MMMSAMHPEVPAPEFSRRVRASDLEDDNETVVAIAADEDERAALAKRFDLAELPSLRAVVRLRRSGSIVSVSADIEADVVQTCVVSLEPLTSAIRERASRLYLEADEEGEGDMPEEIVVEIGEDDPPETIVGGMIDIGEMVSEEMGLLLDPYPRRPDAVLAPPQESESGEPGGDSPFAALRRLKDQAR